MCSSSFRRHMHFPADLGWAHVERKIESLHIQPERPMQNGHVEIFHGKLRDECLNVS
jgi:putative transposase